MRLFAILIAIPLVTSCSKDAVSTHNFPGWSLNDFNPFRHAPPVVEVREETLQDGPQEQFAYHKSNQRPARQPVDYTPPSLPAGGLALDGSLLPSKGGGFQAVFDIDGDLPGASSADSIRNRTDAPQTFSIE